MGKGWTEERRKKQAETIRRNKPWEKSTGPKTENGKKRACMNALKHGNRSQAIKEILQLLQLNQEFLKGYNKFILADNLVSCKKNGFPSSFPRRREPIGREEQTN